MAGETSQSWQKVKEEQRHVLHGSRQENECPANGEAPYKTVRSRENSFTITRTTWRKQPHDSIIFTYSLQRHMGMMGVTIQDEI